MNKIFILTKKTRIYNFARKVKKIRKDIIPLKNSEKSEKDDYINPELLNLKKPEKKISEKIKSYIKLGYSQTDIINLISKDPKKEITNFEKLQNLSTASKVLKNKDLPINLKSELEKYKKAEEIIKNYEQNHDMVTKLQTTPEKIKYNEMINEIIEGKSIIDDNTLQKSLEPLLKKFKKEDIIEIEKERRDLLENRGEMEELKNLYEKKTNLQKKSKLEESITFDQMLEEDEEDNLTLTQEQLDLERELNEYKDWNEKLSKDQIDARVDFFVKKHGMDKNEAKHMLKEEFFMRKKIEKDDLIFERRQEKRERNKKMKKLSDKMLRNNLEIMDYENDKEYRGKEIVQTGVLNPKAYFEKESFQNSKKLLENKKLMPDKKHDFFTIHRLQTVRNFFNYLKDFFSPLNQQGLSWTYGIQINIEDVYLSKNAHFIYVFWDFNLEKDSLQKELKFEINMRLNKYATELGNKMFIALGLRKPINIVFLESVKKETGKELRKSLKNDLKKKKILEMKQNFPEVSKKKFKSGKVSEEIDRIVEDAFIEKKKNVYELV